jgi:membrane protein
MRHKGGGTMGRVLCFFKMFRLSLWRAFNHDAFGIAKAGAYSSIISMFPALLTVASVLALGKGTERFIQEISDAVGRILPPGSARTAQSYFRSTAHMPLRVLITTSLITLWTGSGVMVSWMEGFRHAYQLPKVWGVVKERFIAFGLVIMAGLPMAFATALVAFGAQIERWAIWRAGHELGWYIIVLWTALRWLIAILTSIAVMSLIYHHAVPRTLRWHTVLPGAALATGIWFPTTVLFGWYVSHFAEYSLLYGSLAAAIVLLVWLYILNVIVLIGAEFNALVYPRTVNGKNGKPICAEQNTSINVG